MLIAFVLTLSVLPAYGRDLNSHLANPAWKEDLSAGTQHLSSQRTKRALDQLQPVDPDQPCEANGKPGRCRLVHQCPQDTYKDNYLVFMDNLCIIGSKTIGVCCLEEILEQEGLAGSLPATAPIEEENEAILRIAKAENRGCGVSTRAAGRLVGARPADIKEWPWMAYVVPIGEIQYCGGTLITDRHVLTAAHCTRRYGADELLVRLGEYDVKRTNDSRTYTFGVAEVRKHELYEAISHKNDIAILKLNRPAVFNGYVWPACLPPTGLDLVNQTAYIIGWGAPFFGGGYSPVLMEAPVPIWPHQKCVDSFVDAVFDENICAAAYEGGVDSCQGDSGGPLMYQLSSGRWTVVGVVSWGIRCGEPNHPGIYMKVESYLKWIMQNTLF